MGPCWCSFMNKGGNKAMGVSQLQEGSFQPMGTKRFLWPGTCGECLLLMSHGSLHLWVGEWSFRPVGTNKLPGPGCPVILATPTHHPNISWWRWKPWVQWRSRTLPLAAHFFPTNLPFCPTCQYRWLTWCFRGNPYQIWGRNEPKMSPTWAAFCCQESLGLDHLPFCGRM